MLKQIKHNIPFHTFWFKQPFIEGYPANTYITPITFTYIILRGEEEQTQKDPQTAHSETLQTTTH